MTKAIENANSSYQFRILFVDHAAVLGGAELSLYELAAAYRTTSKVLLFDEGPFLEKLRQSQIFVDVEPAPASLLSLRSSGGLGSLFALPAVWWMAKKVLHHSKSFDVVLANSQKAFVAAAIARLMGSPPVIWHLRDILTAGHFSSINRRLAVSLANLNASKVIVNSKATADAFIASKGNSNLVRLLYNGISTKEFDRLNSIDKNVIKERLNLSSDSKVIGCFSRLSYWKGQHVLLESVKDIKEVHVLIVGDALFGEEEYSEKLKQFVQLNGLTNRVYFLGFRNDIPELMSVCDIIAHTSTEPEPFGRVIVEGQLAKRLVIATNAGGAKEIIQDGVTGILVPPGDATSLQRVIRNLLDSPNKIENIRQKGFQCSRAKFSLENYIKNFRNIVCEIELKRE